mgnify:CR=1 FL=1
MLSLRKYFWMQEKILIIGSSGQIGTELVIELRLIYGDENVIASDIRDSSFEVMNSGPFENLDIMNKNLLRDVVKAFSAVSTDMSIGVHTIERVDIFRMSH